MPDQVLIVGGGLAGLSAARSLAKAGEEHLLLEGERRVGGLCRSEEVGSYLFDQAGHLLHLRPGRVRGQLLSLLGHDLAEHSRRASVFVEGTFVPYPIQAFFGALGPERAERILSSFKEAVPAGEGETPSFLRWAESQFGRELTDAFFRPYNRKLFVHPLAELLPTWTDWAVPRPTPAQMERAAREKGNAGTAFGYNASFFYPRSGGIELLPRRLAEGLEERVRTSCRVVAVDAARRTVTVEESPGEGRKPRREVLPWRRLISTAPLPELLGMTSGLPASLTAAGARLRWSSVLCVCLGARGFESRPEHWIYFPGEGVPFHRVGLPGNYSRRVGPAGAVSFSVECAFDPRRPPDLRLLARTARRELASTGLIPPRAVVEAEGTLTLPYGYVFFDRFREENLPKILSSLQSAGIDSVGRFGSWGYSAMQDAVEQGAAAAKRALA